MIVCTSLKPFSESADVAENQRRASVSWNQHFAHIAYFGHLESELATPKTEFFPEESFVKIKRLAEYLANQRNDLGAIVNADILIGPNFTEVERELKARNAKAGMSRRFQFNDPKLPFDAHLVDLGIDFFFASAPMWAMIAREIPPQFRMGHCLWDTWMLAFMSRWAGRDCYDCTPQRFVFHPNHQDRRSEYRIDATPDTTLSHLRWPPGRLRCCIKR